MSLYVFTINGIMTVVRAVNVGAVSGNIATRVLCRGERLVFRGDVLLASSP